MLWGSLELDRGMGPAANVLIDEYERRLKEFGSESAEIRSLAATELGFEHNLGLLHKAHYVSGRQQFRRGIPEEEYYLERCLLEAFGSSVSDEGFVMCASVVGDTVVHEKYRQLFGRERVIAVPPHLQVPELHLHPASTVGAVNPGCDDAESSGVEAYTPGYCYLALMHSEYASEAEEVLGPNPRLADLLAYGQRGAFLPDSDLAGLSLQGTGVGYHVVVGYSGIPFLDVLKSTEHQPNGLHLLSDQGRFGNGLVGADPSDVLCKWLSDQVGKQIRLSEASLELVTSSAALLGTDSKKRLRSLEAMGDSVLSMVLARDNYLRGEPVERYQNIRSNVTSNKVLSDKFVSHVPAGAVAFLPNVNPAAGVTGAKALEAIFGAVWLDLGDEVLSKLLEKMGFIDFSLYVGSQAPVVAR